MVFGGSNKSTVKRKETAICFFIVLFLFHCSGLALGASLPLFFPNVLFFITSWGTGYRVEGGLASFTQGPWGARVPPRVEGVLASFTQGP